MGVKLKLIAETLRITNTKEKTIAEWEQLLKEEYLRIIAKYHLPLIPAKVIVNDAKEFCFQAKGRWRPALRTIEVSLLLIMTESWREVIRNLKHEIAHQAADEIYGERVTTDRHNSIFRELCKKLEIPSEASDH